MARLDDVRAALQELAAMVKAEVIKRLRSPIGINRAAGFNTLEGSHLEKSIETYVTEESNGIVFVIADYFSYVAGGRRHGLTPRGQDVFGAIERWVKEKHIRLGNLSENQVIWAVLNKLKVQDLPARPFILPDYDYSKGLDEILPFLDKMVDDWFDSLFEKLMQQTDNYFNSN